MRQCEWDYCTDWIANGMRYCPEHRDMKWWEEYEEHVKHLCWEEEEIPLDDFEDALEIVYASRKKGGPKEAVERLEEEHGVNPEIFGERWSEIPVLNGLETFK